VRCILSLYFSRYTLQSLGLHHSSNPSICWIPGNSTARIDASDPSATPGDKVVYCVWQANLDFDNDDDERVLLLVHDTRPPFLDGHINFSKQVRRDPAAPAARRPPPSCCATAHLQSCMQLPMCSGFKLYTQCAAYGTCRGFALLMVKRGCGNTGLVLLPMTASFQQC